MSDKATPKINHLVAFSGGVGSWAAAKRVVERHGSKGTVLLFADTMTEDEDLYRFIQEAADNVGAPLIRIADGRNIWELMRDQRMMGGGMKGADPCSKVLKRELMTRWFKENCQPDTVTHLGIDWTETHRLERVRAKMPDRQWSAPMTEPPYLEKTQMREWLQREGIREPRLYGLGFPHNNCGGFCVKAGQAQFALLLKAFPDRYAYHEAEEEKTRQALGKDVSVLRYEKNGRKHYMTMKEFREERERQASFDIFDWGGCGCAID